MTHSGPWERHFGLAEDRLKVVGKILEEVREQALEEFNPKHGDGWWSHGCKVHERSCNRFVQAEKQYRWLKVVDPTLHFVFTIGGVPIRFFRGDSDSPKKKLLERRPLEIRQQQVAFSFMEAEEEGWFWRIAVEVDADGHVADIVIFETRESGETRNHWSIPLDSDVSVLTSLGELPEAVQLEPAAVGIRLVEEFEEELDGPSGRR